MPKLIESDPVAETIAANIKFLRRKLAKGPEPLSQQELADLLGTTQASINRWENGLVIPQEANLNGLAKLAGCTPSQFRYDFLERREGRPPMVPVVGVIGAGEEVLSTNETAASGALERVALPPGITDTSLVALRVHGDSYRPLRDGWLVFYRAGAEGVAPDCLNALCVVKLLGGPMLIKEVRRGYKPNTFNLVSWNAGLDPLEDQRLEWAAPVEAMSRP
jgi:transcriptional regulator with XRE-family HTH domain